MKEYYHRLNDIKERKNKLLSDLDYMNVVINNSNKNTYKHNCSIKHQIDDNNLELQDNRLDENNLSINLKKSNSLLKKIKLEYKYIIDDKNHLIYYDVSLNNISIGKIKILNVSKSDYSYEKAFNIFVYFANNKDIAKITFNERKEESLDKLKELLYNKINDYISVIKLWEQ